MSGIKLAKTEAFVRRTIEKIPQNTKIYIDDMMKLSELDSETPIKTEIRVTDGTICLAETKYFVR